MKLIKHPNVVQMYEVLASKTKIFIVLELVRGGELFDQIGSLLSFLAFANSILTKNDLHQQ